MCPLFIMHTKLMERKRGVWLNHKSLNLPFLQVLLGYNDAPLFPSQLSHPLQLSGQLTSREGLFLCYLLRVLGTLS